MCISTSNHRHCRPTANGDVRPRLFGTVSGLLTDPSGAVVQGVSVVLADENKGYKFTAKSDETGRYLFRAIPPGVYSVTAEKQGFEKNVRTHIKLDVSDNATANLTLKLASAKETVEVMRRPIPSRPRMPPPGRSSTANS